MPLRGVNNISRKNFQSELGIINCGTLELKLSRPVLEFGWCNSMYTSRPLGPEFNYFNFQYIASII